MCWCGKMTGVVSSRVHDLTSQGELHRFIVPGMICFQLNGSSVQLDSFWSCQDKCTCRALLRCWPLLWLLGDTGGEDYSLSPSLGGCTSLTFCSFNHHPKYFMENLRNNS